MSLRTDQWPFTQNQIDHHKEIKIKGHTRSQKSGGSGPRGRSPRPTQNDRAPRSELVSALRRRRLPQERARRPGSRSAPRGREPLRAPPRGLPAGLQSAQSWDPRVCTERRAASASAMSRGAPGERAPAARPAGSAGGLGASLSRAPGPRALATPSRAPPPPPCFVSMAMGTHRAGAESGCRAGRPQSPRSSAPAPRRTGCAPPVRGAFRDAGIQRPKKVKGLLEREGVAVFTVNTGASAGRSGGGPGRAGVRVRGPAPRTVLGQLG